MVLYATLLAGIARAAVWDDNARNETPDCALGWIFFFVLRTRNLRNACRYHLDLRGRCRGNDEVYVIPNACFALISAESLVSTYNHYHCLMIRISLRAL